MMDIQLKGLEELTAKMDNMDETIENALKGWILQALQQVRAAEVALVPVDSGELRKSIKTEQITVGGEGVMGRTYTNVEHGVYNEFGTGQRGASSPNPNPNVHPAYSPKWAGMAAQPFMYPGYKAAEKRIEKDLVQRLKSALRGL